MVGVAGVAAVVAVVGVAAVAGMVVVAGVGAVVVVVAGMFRLVGARQVYWVSWLFMVVVMFTHI